MDLQRIPKDTKEVPRQDASRQPIEEQDFPQSARAQFQEDVEGVQELLMEGEKDWY